MIELEIIEGPEYHRDEDGWEHNAYTVRLTRKQPRRSMQVPWRQGVGITDDPTAAMVLEALASDAATVENSIGFEDWAEDLGYDPDSRKAEKIYRAVRSQTDKLHRFLGDEYDATIFPEGPDYDSEKAIRQLVEAV